MLNRLVQPNGNTTVLTDKKSLSHIYGVEEYLILFIDESIGHPTPVNGILIVEENNKKYSTVNVTGNILSYTINEDDTLNLVTSSGSVALTPLYNMESFQDALISTAPGMGCSNISGVVKRNVITDFLTKEEIISLESGEKVNIDRALTTAQNSGIFALYFPLGHYVISTITQIADMILIGSNNEEFGDIQLTNTDGSTGQLSLATEGSVLHLTGDTAQNGITFRSFKNPSSYVGVSGFSVYYPEQDWKNWTLMGQDIDGNDIYKPTVYPAAFIVLNPMRVSFSNLFFINAYDWIKITNVQQAAIHHIAGTLINSGLKVTRMAAGSYADTINAYPYWTWACNFAGVSSRVNAYCDYKGLGVEIGADDGNTTTVEQFHLNRVTIIGCADGIVLNGKGTAVTYAKLDNCMRGITVNSADNSAYHTITNVWISSYYRNNYVQKQRTDGSCYGIKSNTATPIVISNVQIIRADGYGIWLPFNSGNVVSTCIVQGCMHIAYVFGSSGRSTDVISVNGCFAGMYTGDTTLTQVAFSIGDFTRCDIKGLQYKGASNTTPYVLNNTLNYYEEGKELDLSTLGGVYYKGTGNGRFTQERGQRGFIVGTSPTATTAVQVINFRGTNTGATGVNVGLGIRNSTTSGNGYGSLELYASVAGVVTPVAEVYSDGSTLGIRPVISNNYNLGDSTLQWRNGFFSNAVYIGGNPVTSIVGVPASATATGTVGQIAQDGSYLYICTATNTWKRTPISTW